MMQVLQEEEEAEIIAQHGVELFLVTLTKLFGSLQEAYKGQFLLGLLAVLNSSITRLEVICFSIKFLVK
jgi:hypothetical protein